MRKVVSIDYTGQRFGYLVCIRPTSERAHNGSVKWEMQCDCGKTVIKTPKSCGETSSCGCRFSKNHVKKGQNDFASTHPEMLIYWDYDKNTIDPSEIGFGSEKSVWWKCEKHPGIGYEMPILQKSNGQGCPICSGKRVVAGFNDLATTNPELLEEWDYEKNNILHLTPEQVSKGSAKKVWWKCSYNHGSYFSAICNRTIGQGCPKCGRIKTAEHKATPRIGINDLAGLRPDLLKEWDYEKNIVLPQKVTVNSSKQYYWKCKENHSWKASPNTRNRGHGCPYCAGLLPIIGINDLSTICPDLAKEWDYSKNKTRPEEYLPMSSKKVWWICPLGHSYDARISDRKKGNGCPYCSNPAKRVLVGFNDLATTNPEMAAEWDYERNKKTPQEVTKGNNTSVFWKCPLGHSYRQQINVRTGQGCGCPYCSNPPKQVLSGFNDLAYKYPELLSRWDYEKNKKRPEEILPGSRYNAWWKCELGHSYQAPIHDITSGNGCSVCAKEKRTSFPELAIYYYLKKAYPDTVSGDKRLLNGLELDVYIPSLKTAIEYDGTHWHLDSNRDKNKARVCEANGIRLIRVKEEDSRVSSESLQDTYYYRYGKWDELSEIIRCILLSVGTSKEKIEVDINKDMAAIQSLYIVSVKDRSLSVDNPVMASQWHPTKNGLVKPDMVKANSNKSFWWICEKGHDWQAKVSGRNGKNKQGCPYCSNKRVWVGFNDVATTHPEIAKEWDYALNESLTPQDFTYGNCKNKVWWICPNGHPSYLMSIYQRTAGGQGCPICGRKKLARYFAKRVKNLDTGDEYESATEAQRITGIRHISEVCCGKNKSAGGYHWAYIDQN